MEVLKATKDRTATEGYELFSPILVDKDLTFKVDFYIEEWWYYEEKGVINHLNTNQHLKLCQESNNTHNQYAVKILTYNNEHIGYVSAFTQNSFLNIWSTAGY